MYSLYIESNGYFWGKKGENHIGWLTHQNLEENESPLSHLRRAQISCRGESAGKMVMLWTLKVDWDTWQTGNQPRYWSTSPQLARLSLKTLPNSLKWTCWSYWVVTLHLVAQKQRAHKGVSAPISAGLVRGAILEPLSLILTTGKTPGNELHAFYLLTKTGKLILKCDLIIMTVKIHVKKIRLTDCTKQQSLKIWLCHVERVFLKLVSLSIITLCQ